MTVAKQQSQWPARLRVFKHLPLSLGLVVLIWLVGAVTGSLLNGPGPDLLAQVALARDIGSGTWFSIVTSAFFASSLLDYLAVTVVIMVTLSVAERVLGWWCAGLVFVLGGMASALILIGLIALGTAGNDEWLQYLGVPYIVGAYGGSAAALGFATTQLEILWKRRVRTWLLAATLMFTFYVGTAQALQALVGTVLGILGGALLNLLSKREVAGPLHRSSLRETRFLISIIVGVFALGPLLTQLMSAFAAGPLILVKDLMLQTAPDVGAVSAACSGDQSCINLQSVVGFGDSGAVLLSLIPVLLLLICADGIRRGRRLAYRIALVIHGYLVIVVLLAIVQFLFEPDVVMAGEDLAYLLTYVVSALAAPLAIFILLIINRGKFNVASSDASYKSLFRTTVSLVLAAVVLYTVCWFAAGNLGRSDGWNLLGQLTHILIPLPMPFVTELPHGLLTGMIYGYVGAVIWLVILLLVFRNFQRFHGLGKDSAADIDHARALLHEGGGSLSWMALWENNQYSFTENRQAGVAYQVRNRVALSVAGPFGSAAQLDTAATGFVAHCVKNGLTPCFYSAPALVGGAVSALGFRGLEVAEETLLNIAAMTFKGKEWQNVRTALNRADKLGIKDLWFNYRSMPPGIRAQLAEISEEWVAEKSLPEMGFTLGGLDELKDDEVLYCVAVDDDCLVHGVTSWLPAFTAGRITGWTLDFMRRRTTAFKGVMEFLIASAVTHFKADVPMISLSGSPLATAGTRNDDGDHSAIDRVLALLGDALEPMYGFKSLAAFKSRFQPQHRTLYLYYQDPLALPSIGLAVTSAYLPGLSTRQSAGLVRRMVAREPAS